MKLFEVSGIDYDCDSFTFLKVAEDKESLLLELERLEDVMQLSDRHYGYSVIEKTEIDGYRIRLERVDD